MNVSYVAVRTSMGDYEVRRGEEGNDYEAYVVYIRNGEFWDFLGYAESPEDALWRIKVEEHSMRTKEER